jgi:hypothetical protein
MTANWIYVLRVVQSAHRPQPEQVAVGIEDTATELIAAGMDPEEARELASTAARKLAELAGAMEGLQPLAAEARTALSRLGEALISTGEEMS